MSRRFAESEHEFDHVDCAFLEIAEPSIPEGLERSIERGAEEVVIFPHFLAAGRHVTEDIPAEVASVEVKYPGVSVRIAPHLGASSLMVDAILNLT